MASMLSGAMAAVGQARTDATAALERGVERAKAAATDAVEHARGSVVSLSTTAPTPCAVCGRPTRSGDGGACGDVGDMAGKEPKEGPRRCYSCLTAAENEQVEATRKQQHETLDSFFAGEPPPVHVDPEETSLEKAHRLGSLALGGAVDLMGWIPGVGSITKGTIQVLHKVVKFGPLALYSAELVETLQLLVVMANRTGAAKVAEEEAESGTGKAPTGRALEVSEMSVGFYYLLLEHRNAAAVDPERVLREHQRCSKVEAAVLDDLADCLPLGCNVAYASNPAEAQRQLRLLGNWELVLREGQAPWLACYKHTFSGSLFGRAYGGYYGHSQSGHCKAKLVHLGQRCGRSESTHAEINMGRCPAWSHCQPDVGFVNQKGGELLGGGICIQTPIERVEDFLDPFHSALT